MAEYILDSKLMASIAKLPKASRDAAMREIGKIEWTRCADDIMYWVDVSRHPALPYVYTADQHVYFICNHCNDGNEYHAKQRRLHMKVAHNIVTVDEKQLR